MQFSILYERGEEGGWGEGEEGEKRKQEEDLYLLIPDS